MDDTHKSMTIHKHYHYHYHYDINDKYLRKETERYSSPSLCNSQKSLSTPYKVSWKNYINPQVNKLYEEISINESFDQNFTPKASRHSQRQIRNFSNTLNPEIFQRHPRSQAQILQEISAYKEYLKEHSSPNFYVPNTPNLRRIPSLELQSSLARKVVSLKEFTENRKKCQRTQEEVIMARTHSKIISAKQDLSTLQETQHPESSQLYFSKKEIVDSQKYFGRSEIKIPKSSGKIFEKAKIRMSCIQEPLTKQKTEELENSNFSSFQRQAKKESREKSHELFSRSLNNKFQKGLSEQGFLENKKTIDFSNYALELMRQECNSLRNKYIEHTQNDHGVKC